MSLISYPVEAWTNRYLIATRVAVCRLHRWIAAYQRALMQRRTIDRLLDMRTRDPQLFEELRIDPAALPPPKRQAASMVPHTVIAGFFWVSHH